MPDPIIDDAGQEHTPAAADARILSLVPSLTELVFELGLGGKLVGRTDFCVHPAPAVGAVTSVGGTKRIDMAKAAALGASHALVNIDETPKSVADELAAKGMEVVVTHPNAVTDNTKLYRLIGALFGAEDAAAELSRAFDTALRNLRHAAGPWPERPVLYLIWRKPWMSIAPDTYIAAMLAEARWRAVTHGSDDRYPEVSLDEALLERVELVLFSTEPFPFTEKHLEQFRALHPAHAAKARLIDAEMVSWYGSRAVAGLDYLKTFAGGLRS